MESSWNAPRAGRHFLQIPGPTNVPDSVLRTIAQPTIDHRGPAFADLASGVLTDVRAIFQTDQPVIIYPASGTGAWEAALANTCSPGDKVLMFDMGHFTRLWADMARRFGLDVEFVPIDWRIGVTPDDVAAALAADSAKAYRAIAIVHNETSTGVTVDLQGIRAAIDAADHPALLLVDAVSSLGSIDYRHDEWKVDVTVAGSQKGLMLPPGLGFNAISAKARDAASTATLPRAFWDWESMLAANASGMFPYTPATNLLYGLREAIDRFAAEGLENVFTRHARHAAAARAAVDHWGLEIYASIPERRSNSCTTILIEEPHSADELRGVILDSFDMSLGGGLSDLAGKVFRIGHLGDFNDLMLAGTLAGIEAGLIKHGVPIHTGGVEAALAQLTA